jgi:hypothetical protein
MRERRAILAGAEGVDGNDCRADKRKETSEQAKSYVENGKAGLDFASMKKGKRTASDVFV